MYETKIENVSEQLVRDAIESLAAELDATVITNMTSDFWERQKVVAGLKMKGLDTGIGVRVDDGKLTVVGDPWGQEEQFERLQQLLPAAVQLQQVKRNAKNRRLRTRMQVKEKELQLVVCGW